MSSASPRTDARALFQVALAVFAVSVLVGTLDGQQRLTLDRAMLEAHERAGMLGWITLGAIASALLLFGMGAPSIAELRLARAISLLCAIVIPGYALAFLVAIPWLRVALGVMMLLAILLTLGWVGMRGVQSRPDVAQVALLLALLALTFGATVGVLLQVQEAAGRSFFTAETTSVQRMALIAGYQPLLGMVIIEWRLMPPAGHPPLIGIAQVALLFLGGAVLAAGILLGMPMLYLAALVLEVAATAIFAARCAGPAIRTSMLKRGGARHYALAALFLVLTLALVVYLIGAVRVGRYSSFAFVSPTLMTAIQHSMSLGVLTNALFGLIADFPSAFGGGRSWRFWPAADEVLFWGMNVGLIGFLGGLFARPPMTAALLEGIFTPILGASILVGLVAHFVRLQRSANAVATPAGVSRREGADPAR